uniref:Uncharacterized protein n=1 Tax=Alexandrium monilatum TaxID=311494 RepID=A0A7S4R941_9DINO
MGKPPLGIRSLSGGLLAKAASGSLGPATPASSSAGPRRPFSPSTLGSGTRLRGKERRSGCECWQVLLEKRQGDEQFGFATISGKLEMQRRSNGALQGPETLIVWRVKEDGLLADWNREFPDVEVQPQDRICSVNNEITIEGMQREIKSPRVLLRVMRYAERFSVKLAREGRLLGCRYEAADAAGLQEMRVLEIGREGALHSHNAEQVDAGLWHFVVLPDMRIESINGVTGNVPKMVERLTGPDDEVTLVVRRGERAQARQKQLRGKVKLLAKVVRFGKAGPVATASPAAGSDDDSLPEATSICRASTGLQDGVFGADGPGSYVLKERAVVAPTVRPCPKEDVITELAIGTRVTVLQVVSLHDIDRVRGRLEDPPGWISLVDTEGGFRWAERQAGRQQEAAGREEPCPKEVSASAQPVVEPPGVVPPQESPETGAGPKEMSAQPQHQPPSRPPSSSSEVRPSSCCLGF